MSTVMGECELSIVIVSYNTLEMTRECLCSVLAHCNSAVTEIIVVDNKSQDGTQAMIRREFPAVILIENAENRGFAAANNQAFAVCRGRYILLLNSDTVILGEVLQASVGYLEEHPRCGAMGCRVLNADKSVQRTCSGFPTLKRLLFMTLALDRIGWFSRLDTYLMRWWQRNDERNVEVISGCFLMTRNIILERIGVLDESFFFFGEETDWCKRVRDAGWCLTFAPVGSIIHHGGGSVKKLSYKRDVMLTAATVRLHRKHGGVLSEVAAYAILMGFNLSRAVMYTLLAWRYPTCREMGEHFRKVVSSWRECWPIRRTM